MDMNNESKIVCIANIIPWLWLYDFGKLTITKYSNRDSDLQSIWNYNW